MVIMMLIFQQTPILRPLQEPVRKVVVWVPLLAAQLPGCQTALRSWRFAVRALPRLQVRIPNPYPREHVNAQKTHRPQTDFQWKQWSLRTSESCGLGSKHQIATEENVVPATRIHSYIVKTLPPHKKVVTVRIHIFTWFHWGSRRGHLSLVAMFHFLKQAHLSGCIGPLADAVVHKGAVMIKPAEAGLTKTPATSIQNSQNTPELMKRTVIYIYYPKTVSKIKLDMTVYNCPKTVFGIHSKEHPTTLSKRRWKTFHDLLRCCTPQDAIVTITAMWSSWWANDLTGLTEPAQETRFWMVLETFGGCSFLAWCFFCFVFFLQTLQPYRTLKIILDAWLICLPWMPFEWAMMLFDGCCLGCPLTMFALRGPRLVKVYKPWL